MTQQRGAMRGGSRGARGGGVGSYGGGMMVSTTNGLVWRELCNFSDVLDSTRTRRRSRRSAG